MKGSRQHCSRPDYVQCLYGDQDVVREAFNKAEGDDECLLKWNCTTILRKHLAILENMAFGPRLIVQQVVMTMLTLQIGSTR